MANVKTSTQYHKHKKYRWIALALKLISIPIFTFLFQNLVQVISLHGVKPQALGTFLTTLLSLVIYYGTIFFLNRYRNFHSNTSLRKSLAVYILVVIILMTIESMYNGPIQNKLYDLTHLGLIDGATVISIATVKNKLVYLGIGFGVHLAFSTITGIIIFILYKKVLDKEEVLAKI